MYGARLCGAGTPARLLLTLFATNRLTGSPQKSLSRGPYGLNFVETADRDLKDAELKNADPKDCEI
jgi:hypothetical protein